MIIRPASGTKLSLYSKFEIDPLPPFDFQLTVRKPAGWDLFTPGEVFEDETLWTGIRLGSQPVGLKISSSGVVDEPHLRVGVFTEGGRLPHPAPSFQEIIVDCLGLEQDLRGFYSFAAEDSILKHVVKDLYGMHDTQTVSVFNSVVLSICLQMARPKRSGEMIGAINEAFGETIEFDRKRVLLQPAAETICKLNPVSFAKRCKLGYRAKYIVGSAKMISKGFPSMAEIMEMPADKAKERLMELPGVGDYAADIINPHGGFPIDAWSVDVFGALFFGKEPKDRRAAVEMVKREGLRRWGNWSWMAFFYVAQDLERLSARLGVKLRLE